MTRVIEVELRSAGLSPEERARVRDLVGEACRPIAQSWPMKTFAYRNPLRGLEHLPFDEAVRQGERLFGGKGYLPNDDYREFYRQGKVTDVAVEHALAGMAAASSTPEITAGGRRITSAEVLRLHLLHGLDPLEPALLDWQLTTGRATERFRPDVPPDVRKSADEEPAYLSELWKSTLAAVGESDESGEEDHGQPAVELPPGRTLSDWVETLTGESVVDDINGQMIKWTAAFLDEGMADWSMPGRDRGFYHTWRELAPKDISCRFLGIRNAARKIRELPDAPEDAISHALVRLGIPHDRRTEYLTRTLAQLPGWAGFIRWLGENPAYPAAKDHPIDPLQNLAVRVFYEVEFTWEHCQREWRIDGTLEAIRGYWEDRPDQYRERMGLGGHPVDPRTHAVCADGWRLFHLAQFLGLNPDDVKKLDRADTRVMLGWLDVFPSVRHGPVWLNALEATFRGQLIKRLASHRGKASSVEGRPRAQIVMCIDARSESFRRHIEAQGPYETHGFAGFFGIPLSFEAFDTEGHAALCPVIVSPKNEVNEVPRPGEDQPLRGYAAGSRWGRLGGHLFHDLKSNPISSFMLIDVLGLFFSVGLVGKTFLRRAYESIKSMGRGLFTRRVATRIPVDRTEEQGDAPPAIPHGFTVAERATFVEKGLRAIGVTGNFGRFIVLCGHGSTSENNPYFAAYNCGACGGGHGDPNARVFAGMGNQPEVRRALKENGLDVPDDTWFLAAKHNTATDEVSFYDLQDVPDGHAEDLRRLIEDLAVAGKIQALERSRRLPGSPKDATPEAAAEHVLARTMDWATVRPEWGLSSNGAFLIGRRKLTRELDLGARVFLHSYDPDGDPEGAILEVLMTAPMVVAQWISMEYYFSSVDPAVYGSGSKVTHNVVSGVGVMHGSHGDLQSGLPLQSVNDGPIHYHEPMRLLVIIEAPTARIDSVIRKHELLQHFFHNRWIHLVAVDPATYEFSRYHTDSTWSSAVDG